MAAVEQHKALGVKLGIVELHLPAPASVLIVVAETHTQLESHPVVHIAVFGHRYLVVVRHRAANKVLCREVVPDAVAVSLTIKYALQRIDIARVAVIEVGVEIARTHHSEVHRKRQSPEACRLYNSGIGRL